jgi:2-succinyl-5-enolpyruvyl-6-hydroxy-3-cyclohexene-1-carboxylate synthase
MLQSRIKGMVKRGWLAQWTDLSWAARRPMDRHLEAARSLSEPGVARMVTAGIPGGHGLFLGNSMPVRDADRFGVHDGAAVRVAAARGASGIDGNLAAAAGFARGLKQPVTCLLGDLAFLHDLNSLALLSGCGQPVTVVVINNNGGGIFSFLSMAELEDVFEEHFGTPHNLDLGRLARGFGLETMRPASCAEFSEAYARAAAGDRSTVIEVVTDRAENRALHEALQRGAAEAVDGLI